MKKALVESEGREAAGSGIVEIPLGRRVIPDAVAVTIAGVLAATPLYLSLQAALRGLSSFGLLAGLGLAAVGLVTWVLFLAPMISYVDPIRCRRPGMVGLAAAVASGALVVLGRGALRGLEDAGFLPIPGTWVHDVLVAAAVPALTVLTQVCFGEVAERRLGLPFWAAGGLAAVPIGALTQALISSYLWGTAPALIEAAWMVLAVTVAGLSLKVLSPSLGTGDEALRLPSPR